MLEQLLILMAAMLDGGPCCWLLAAGNGCDKH